MVYDPLSEYRPILYFERVLYECAVLSAVWKYKVGPEACSPIDVHLCMLRSSNSACYYPSDISPCRGRLGRSWQVHLALTCRGGPFA